MTLCRNLYLINLTEILKGDYFNDDYICYAAIYRYVLYIGMMVYVNNLYTAACLAFSGA